MDQYGEDVYNTQKVADYYYDNEEMEPNQNDHGYYSQPVDEKDEYVGVRF